MDQQFGGALHVLRRTNEKLQGLAKEPAGRNLIRMSLFCVLLFLALYFLSPRVRLASFLVGGKHAGSALGDKKFLAHATAVANSPAISASAVAATLLHAT